MGDGGLRPAYNVPFATDGGQMSPMHEEVYTTRWTTIAATPPCGVYERELVR